MSDEYLPIRQAARHFHKSRDVVRRLVDSRLVRAKQIGKTRDGHPWLSVNLKDLEEALEMEERYVPPGPKLRRHAPRPAASSLHPSAAMI